MGEWRLAPKGQSNLDYIGDLLVRDGLITYSVLETARDRMRETSRSLMRVLIEDNLLEESRRIAFIRNQFGVPLVTLKDQKADPLLLLYIPAHLCRRHVLVPVKLDKDGLVVVMEDPTDLRLLDELKELSGLRIKPVLALGSEIKDLLDTIPEPKGTDAAVEAGPRRFDPVARFLTYFFMPIMSLSVLGGIFLLLAYHDGFAAWLKETIGPPDSSARGYQIYTLFLYFFLSWGVWTLVMFEAAGLVFDDLEWRDNDDIPQARSKTKALIFSVLGGLVGLDRFYLGYTRMGILKLLTLGLGGLWWLLDAFSILMGWTPDATGRKLV
jgi:TM2 domain-containing membrane protein YozV